MHDVRVSLHIHQIFNFDRAVLAHSTNVISPKIDQHDVLGAFLFVGEHFFFELLVFRFVTPARMRSSNGAVLELAAGHTNQHLRRRTQHVRVSHFQKVHVWRRIDCAQRTIDIEWRDFGSEVETLREHHLEYVSGGNVLFRFPNGLLELLLRTQAPDLELPARTSVDLAPIRWPQSC